MDQSPLEPRIKFQLAATSLADISVALGSSGEYEIPHPMLSSKTKWLNVLADMNLE